MKRILLIVLIVAMLLSCFPSFAYANDDPENGRMERAAQAEIIEQNELPPFSGGASDNPTITSKYTGKNYIYPKEKADYSLIDMIDVSEHNGVINWYKVKSEGINYAIIRVGYRGYGSEGTLCTDAVYRKNIENAVKAGVKIGIYFYSQAITVNEGIAEADYAISKLKSYKANISLPIYFDYEFAGVSSGRLDYAWNHGRLTKAAMTNIAKAFCQRIEAAGYEAGIYASADYFTHQLDASKLTDYRLWVAYYTTNFTAGSYWHNSNYKYAEIWQYSSTGSVKGICGSSGSWIGVKYGSYSGYIFDSYLDFTGAASAKANESVNLRKGQGTSYDILTVVPKGSAVTITSYPTKNCDMNFYFYDDSIEKTDISEAAVTTAVQYYAGKPLTPKPIVKYNSKTLTEGKDYSLSYSNNQAVGTSAVVTVTGKGSYKGSKSANFTIAPQAVGDFSFASRSGNQKSIELKWTEPKSVSGASYITGYYIYDKSSGSYEQIGTAAKTATSYTISLKYGKSYSLYVQPYKTLSGVTLKGKLSGPINVAGAPSVIAKSTSDSVILSWDKIPNATKYRVYSFNYDTYKYTILGDVTANSYTAKNLQGSTEYTYLVRAYSDAGFSIWDYYMNVTAKTNIAKPTGIKASYSGNTAIKLTWSAVNTATGYRIYQYNESTGKYTRLGDVNSCSYTVNNISVSKRYVFLIRAFNAASFSDYSKDDQFIVTSSDYYVKATAAGGNKSVTLKWNKVKGASYYGIWKYDPATKKYTGITAKNVLSYKITNLNDGAKYYYLVRAYSGGGYSGFSINDVVSAVTLPALPKLTASCTTTAVTLKWNAVNSATEYRVYSYDTASAKYTRLATTSSLSYTVKGLGALTKHYYLVLAANSTGSSVFSKAKDLVSITTAPNKPAANAEGGEASVTLKWNKVTGATAYGIYSYDTTAKTYKGIAKINATSYKIENLAYGTTYTYLIRAFNAYGASDFSINDNVSAITIPNKPVVGVGADGDSIVISWQAVKGADSYRVYQYENSKYTVLGNIKTLKYTLSTNLVKGKTYQFAVRAINSSGMSPFTAAYRVSYIYKQFIFPLPSCHTISCAFEGYAGHTGTDFSDGAVNGKPIVASASGTVKSVKMLTYSYGYHVIIDHGNGYTTLYAHMSRIDVKAGQKVVQGEQIGLVGSTGNSSGPHLHFEIRTGPDSNLTYLDPMKYLS